MGMSVENVGILEPGNLGWSMRNCWQVWLAVAWLWPSDSNANLPTCENFLSPAFFVLATPSQTSACLTEGAQAGSTNEDGETAFHLAAAFSKYPEVISVLFSSIATPEQRDQVINQTDSFGRTPLHRAAEVSNSAAVVARLIELGANPNALYDSQTIWFGPNRGISALLLASRRIEPVRNAILADLLNGGADPFVQMPSRAGKPGGGRTPLHNAVQYGAELSTIDLLIAYQQASLTKVLRHPLDDMGRSPLHLAAESDASVGILNALIEAGYDAGDQDNLGTSALMLYAQFGSEPSTFVWLLGTVVHTIPVPGRSDDPCNPAKNGATIAAVLAANPKLNPVDLSGKTISSIAEYKRVCPD